MHVGNTMLQPLATVGSPNERDDAGLGVTDETIPVNPSTRNSALVSPDAPASVPSTALTYTLNDDPGRTDASQSVASVSKKTPIDDGEASTGSADSARQAATIAILDLRMAIWSLLRLTTWRSPASAELLVSNLLKPHTALGGCSCLLDKQREFTPQAAERILRA